MLSTWMRIGVSITLPKDVIPAQDYSIVSGRIQLFPNHSTAKQGHERVGSPDDVKVATKGIRSGIYPPFLWGACASSKPSVRREGSRRLESCVNSSSASSSLFLDVDLDLDALWNESSSSMTSENSLIERLAWLGCSTSVVSFDVSTIICGT